MLMLLYFAQLSSASMVASLGKTTTRILTLIILKLFNVINIKVEYNKIL
jgi:hypothetical protein